VTVGLVVVTVGLVDRTMVEGFKDALVIGFSVLAVGL
jgi:hypothetical protein